MRCFERLCLTCFRLTGKVITVCRFLLSILPVTRHLYFGSSCLNTSLHPFTGARCKGSSSLLQERHRALSVLWKHWEINRKSGCVSEKHLITWLLSLMLPGLFSCTCPQPGLAGVSSGSIASFSQISWHWAASPGRFVYLQTSCITRFEYQVHTDGFCIALPFGWAAISVPLPTLMWCQPRHLMCTTVVLGRVNASVAPPGSPEACSESFPCVAPRLSCVWTFIAH